jgi:hypothetical protein
LLLSLLLSSFELPLSLSSFRSPKLQFGLPSFNSLLARCLSCFEYLSDAQWVMPLCMAPDPGFELRWQITNGVINCPELLE